MANPQPDQFIKISRELWWAWTRFDMPGDVRRVKGVIVIFTYGFGKKEASIKLKTFVKHTGMDKRRIQRALGLGIALNLFVRVVQSTRGKGATYRIQKDYDKWITMVQCATLNPQAMRMYTRRDLERCNVPPKGKGWWNRTTPKVSDRTTPNEEKKPRKPLPGQTKPEPGKLPIEKHFKDSNTKGLSDLQACEVYFRKLHLETWGEEYVPSWGRDRRDFNNLLKAHGLDIVFKMIERLLDLVQGGDKFYNEFSVPKLWQHRARLIQDLSKMSHPELPTWTAADLAALERTKGSGASEEDKAVVARLQAKAQKYEDWKERQ